jgi:hypothetical protein
MELSKEQIQQVENYLNSKNITYIDLRTEVLDHIVSEIEDKIIENEVTFHHAFAIAKQNWNPKLEEATSMFFGVGFSAPKIVIQKAKKVYWKQYVFLLASYFLPFLLLTYFNFKIQNPTEYSSFILFKGVTILSFVAFIYMLVFRNYKLKTTYGFVLKSQSLSAFIGLIVLAIFFTKLKELNGINIGIFCTFIYTTFSYFHFYKKHQEAIQKYKIS